MYSTSINRHIVCILLIAFLWPIQNASAQIKLGDNAIFGARIGLEMNYYKRTQLINPDDPFRIKLYAQPYFKVKDWDIKLNILAGNYHKKYRQEFNKFGTSIGNDWLTFHIGHHNLQISQFTLNGHTILGGGIELFPSLFRFAGTYGRFRRDIDPTDFMDQFALPSYNRWGFAAKIGVGNTNNYLDLIVLRVEDKTASLDPANAKGVTPNNNGILSIHSFQKLFKQKLELEGELALSAYTEDMTNQEEDSTNFMLPKIAGYLINKNSTTHYSKAINVSLKYQQYQSHSTTEKKALSGYFVKAIYERIDPDYKSMGTYYLRNDLQRIRLTAQLRFNQNKVIVSPQLGYENNDLDAKRIARNKRFIGGINTTIRISGSSLISLNYLNFNSALENNTTDSLVLRQINHNAKVSYSNRHQLKGKNAQFQVSAGYQLGKNKTNESNSTYLGSLNFRTAYNFVVIDKLLTLEPAFRINTYKRTTNHQFRYTPSLAVTTKFMEDKMSLNYNVSAALISFSNGGLTNTTLGNEIRWTYKLSKKQSLSLRLAYLHNFAETGINNGDLRGDIRYNISI